METVAFNAWNHYQMSFDYLNKTYSASLNGVVVDSGIAFATASATHFTDADLAGLRDDGSAFNLSGTAQYDNYVVTTVATPEPTALSMLGLLAAGLLSRRSMKKDMVK